MTDTFGTDGAADTITGGSNDDRIYGGDSLPTPPSGNDTLAGGGGSDTLHGLDENDSLDGGDGADVLYGGAGDDRFFANRDGFDIAISNTLYGDAGDDTAYGQNGADFVYGGSGNDRIFATDAGAGFGDANGNVLYGGDGNDQVYGFDGTDTLYGEDSIAGGDSSAHDTLYGGASNDDAFGGDGRDTLYGGGDLDTLSGDAGSDRLYGQLGIDALYGGNDDDTLYGDENDDIIGGDNGSDTAYGGDGNDLLYGGGDGNDPLYGGAEPDGDILIGAFGDDTGHGGADGDILVGDFLGAVIVTLAAGDRLYGEAGADVVIGGFSEDALFGGEAADWIEDRDGADSMFGGAGDDGAIGGVGDDSLDTGDGNDYAAGGLGNDVLTAGSGEDWLDGGDGADLFVAGEGNDLVLGDFGDDVIDAGTGNDVAAGGAGADIVLGGSGDDVLTGDPSGAVGADTLYGGDGQDQALGGALNDALYGGAGNDLLAGGTGEDFLQGGAGNDLLLGDGGSDTVGYAGTVVTLGSSGDTTTIDAGADGIDTLIGVESILQNQGLFISLPNLAPHLGFLVQGDDAGHSAGGSVASAGDVNGDGFDDLILGAQFATGGGPGAGEAYVVFGSGGVFGTADGLQRRVIDLSSLEAAQGFIIRGDTTDDQAGLSVATAGDINGDGFADVIVGAPFSDLGGGNGGAAFVVFGAAGGFGSTDANLRQVVDLTSLEAAQGFIIQGDTDGDLAGWSVASAGDVNGDGFDDLIVGAVNGDDGSYNAGEAYVVFGTAGGFGVDVTAGSVVRRVIDLTSLGSAQGFIVQGDTESDFAGVSVSSAGDVNGDGLDDLVVGAYRGDDGGFNAGQAYVVFGSASAFGLPDGNGRQAIDLASLYSAQGFVIQGDTSVDYAGFSVSSARDVNGDGFDDLIVGAPRGDDGGGYAGEAYVLFGAAGGFGTDIGGRQVIDLTSLGSAQGFILQGNDGGRAGTSVASAGDVNGDGFGDLVVGSPFGLGGGQAAVVFGAAGGFGTTDVSARQVIDITDLAATEGFLVIGSPLDDQTGIDVSSAGDVNGDGFDDLFVGTPLGDAGGTNAGEAYVLFGSAAFGSGAPIVAAGDGNPNLLIGDRGDDTLTGGSEDVLRGGAGDDTLITSEVDFADIDGGTGIDTLIMSNGGQTLDLRLATSAELQSIERVDLTGSGNNTLVLDELAFFHLTEERGLGTPAVAVLGNSGDAVQLDTTGSETWTVIGFTVLDGVFYNRYQFDADGAGGDAPMANAELWIDIDIVPSFI